ncbi:MAG: carboxylase [Spirochaetes bacterium]|nr:carboxylase [Spirochaetota bacterium]MBU0954894.1 carboxylase [Spirochaetota bacterium]
MARTLKIRDLTLRDGQQSQFATRMTQNQVDRVLPFYKDAGFYAMEVWGGAVPDSVMRYLNENPWKRLESIKNGVQGASKLTALSRGRNLFGYNPYPDSVIEGFCRNSIQSGIDIMRIFDALNDTDNMTSSIRFVKENGGLADCAVCFTVDPKFSWQERVSALFKGRKMPHTLFDIPYFVRKAKTLAALGADIITIKDMAGLVDPATSATLIKALKNEVALPINLHTHCTPGYGVASFLMAMVNGVDIVDTVIMNFSGGPAAPAYEIIQLFADILKLDTGVDRAVVGNINRELRSIREELAKFDQYKRLPPEIDLSTYSMPSDLAQLFADAAEAAVAGKSDTVLTLCQKIEAAFNYPEPDKLVQNAQIPGGMYSNMLAQLQEYKLEQHVDEVLKMVPQVRLDAGIPPLVTPTSQIVGQQAVNCIVDKTQGKAYYSSVSKNFIDLVKGSYGKTPYPVDPAFRQKIAGVREETPYDTSKYKPQPNPDLAEFGGARLAADEKDQLLLELFPSIAEKFLRGVRAVEYAAWQEEHEVRYVYEAPVSVWEDEFWEQLSLNAGYEAL